MYDISVQNIQYKETYSNIHVNVEIDILAKDCYGKKQEQLLSLYKMYQRQLNEEQTQTADSRLVRWWWS